MMAPIPPAKSSRGLRATLALAFFSLCAVVLLINGSIKIVQDIGRHESMLAGRQQLAAREAATAVSQFVNESFQILETAIWMVDLHAEAAIRQRQALRRLLGLRPAFRHLMVLDADQRVLARSSRLSLEGTKWLTEELQPFSPGPSAGSRRLISPVYFDPRTYEPMVTLAVPVTDVFGDARGTLVAELNLKFMWEVVDRLQVERSGYAYVTDRLGRLLAFQDTGRVLKGETLSRIAAVEDFIAGPLQAQPSKARRYRGILGTLVLGSYVPLLSPDWAVVAELPWQEAYRAVLWDVAAGAGITLVLAVLAGWAGILVARKLAAPVIGLTATAARVASGELDLQAEVAGPSEVAGLARAFNSMTDRLRRSLEELETRYADLARTEAALRRSEERLRLATEGTSDGIWDWDLRTGEVYFNPRYYTMMGYAPGEFPGTYKSWRGMLYPDDVPRTEAAVWGAIQARGGFAVEFRFRAKDGSWRWILARGKVVESDPDGKALRMAGSHTDISERKRAEETLHKYERIVACSQDLMALIGRDYVYEAVNDSILAVYSLPREQVVGRTMSEVRGEDVFERNIRPWIDRALAGEAVRYQMALEFGSSGKRILDINYVPSADEHGRVDGVVLNARDITETRKLEEQLIQSQKIESLGTLARGIAHDFNNILGALIGYAELALLELPAGHAARDHLDLVLAAGKRARDLVKQILAFGRQGEEGRKPIQLEHTIREVTKFMRASLPATIEIRQHLEPDLDDVLADPVQIHQVVMNLCTNAGHAMQEGGGVLEIRLAQLGAFPESALRPPGLKPGPCLRLTVRDSGHGMDPATLEKIFDPYFTTKEKGVGTGLGLSVVHGIVQSHGGQITVESAPGQGAQFDVYFPAVGRQARQAASASPELPRGCERILLVDDEAFLADMGRQILTRLGYRVEARTSSVDALEFFRAQPEEFDLVITDMTMPHLTGDRLAMEIQRIRPGTPVLLCTGYSEERQQEAFKAMGIRGIVMKPVLMAQMAVAVREALDKRESGGDEAEPGGG